MRYIATYARGGTRLGLRRVREGERERAIEGDGEQLVGAGYLQLTCGTAPIHQLLENESPALTSSLGA